ncbi:MAG: hypothetical protein FJZ01_07845 [Candidatus Sericytochromatia bacterium]|nr:hypothetical protein [Candidatus Tanganyikabacteria bacterium]
MKHSISHVSKVLPVLIVAGCGTVPAVTAPKAQPQQAKAQAVTAKSDVNVKVAELGTKAAYARLSANPGIVHKGGRSWLNLDVWSDSKKIKSWNARWWASEGMLDRWVTRDSSYNGWWAPFNPFSTYSYIQARVHVDFEDGTDADGTLQVSVWVTQ